MSAIIIPKDHKEFSELVVNHAYRCPDSKISDLVKVWKTETGLEACINADVYRAGQVYAVHPKDMPSVLR